MEIQVACYAGYRGEETPRSLVIGKRRAEIAAILDRWLAPDHRYFKLKTTDDDQMIIRHDRVSSKWELILFQSG